MLKNSTIIGIPTKLDTTFFRHWVEFLKPLHKINDRDCDILAELLHQRHLLLKKMGEDRLVEKLVLSREIKAAVCKCCNITPGYLEVIIHHLRKKGAIVDNRINGKFIPKFDSDEKDAKLIVHFRITE